MIICYITIDNYSPDKLTSVLTVFGLFLAYYRYNVSNSDFYKSVGIGVIASAIVGLTNTLSDVVPCFDAFLKAIASYGVLSLGGLAVLALTTSIEFNAYQLSNCAIITITAILIFRTLDLAKQRGSLTVPALLLYFVALVMCFYH